MSLCMDGQTVGLAYLDISTGESFVTEISGANVMARTIDEIAKVGPAEILMNATLYKEENVVKTLKERFDMMISLYPSHAFEYKGACARILDQFHVFSLLSLGLEDHDSSVRAAGALLGYVDETQKRVLNHINHLSCYKPDEYMVLDLATRRNLELTETIRSGEKRGSLLWVLDKTVTAMGGRLLRRWVEAPLLSAEAISHRLDRIEEFTKNPGAMPELKAILGRVYDLERICGKIAFGNCNPKDLLALKQSIEALKALNDFFQTVDAPAWQSVFGGGDDLLDVYTRIQDGIDDDAPMAIKDGRVIKAGYNAEIDTYREAGDKGKDWIRDLETRERERTGIRSLKVKYNRVFGRVFGYFIEVTKSNLSQVPEDYIRKQTLTNAERYFTPALKEMETKILGSEERLAQLEYQFFQEIRETILSEIARIQHRARDIAACDALYALAVVALNNHYVRPELRDDGIIDIKAGRHPVVEALIGEDHYVTNDCLLDNVANYSIMVKETADGVVFLRKIRPGSVDKSYGIEVAKLAGFPPAVTARAQEILTHLEQGESTYREGMLASEKPAFLANQIDMFNLAPSAPAMTEDEQAVLDTIKDLNINGMTPMDAMNALNQLNNRLK